MNVRILKCGVDYGIATDIKYKSEFPHFRSDGIRLKNRQEIEFLSDCDLEHLSGQYSLIIHEKITPLTIKEITRTDTNTFRVCAVV
jgi:hypothetical protein